MPPKSCCELRVNREQRSALTVGAVLSPLIGVPVVSKNTNELKIGSPGRFGIDVYTLGWPMGARIFGHEDADPRTVFRPRPVAAAIRRWALLTTTVVLSAGFMAFATSGFEVSWSLGLLVTMTIFLLGKRYLIHDRDPLFTEAVRGLLRDSGVKPLRLPANSPNLNAYAERSVLSIRREGIVKLTLSERTYRVELTSFALIGRHRLPPARR